MRTADGHSCTVETNTALESNCISVNKNTQNQLIKKEKEQKMKSNMPRTGEQYSFELCGSAFSWVVFTAHHSAQSQAGCVCRGGTVCAEG